MGSHVELKRWYAAFNRHYFNSKLPREMEVFYAPSDSVHGLAELKQTGEASIQIDTTLAGTRYAKLVLLHECNHHFTGDWGHGKRFQEGMMRLAKIGAFRKLW